MDFLTYYVWYLQDLFGYFVLVFVAIVIGLILAAVFVRRYFYRSPGVVLRGVRYLLPSVLGMSIHAAILFLTGLFETLLCGGSGACGWIMVGYVGFIAFSAPVVFILFLYATHRWNKQLSVLPVSQARIVRYKKVLLVFLAIFFVITAVDTLQAEYRYWLAKDAYERVSALENVQYKETLTELNLIESTYDLATSSDMYQCLLDYDWSGEMEPFCAGVLLDGATDYSDKYLGYGSEKITAELMRQAPKLKGVKVLWSGPKAKINLANNDGEYYILDIGYPNNSSAYYILSFLDMNGGGYSYDGDTYVLVSRESGVVHVFTLPPDESVIEFSGYVDIIGVANIDDDPAQELILSKEKHDSHKDDDELSIASIAFYALDFAPVK